MPFIITGIVHENRRITWSSRTDPVNEHKQVYISIAPLPIKSATENAHYVADLLRANEVTWMWPVWDPRRSDVVDFTDPWVLDFESIRQMFPALPYKWAIGQRRCRGAYFEPDIRNDSSYYGVWFEPNVEDLEDLDMLIPPDLVPYLDTFRRDYPDPRKCAFVMMRFEPTRLHQEVFKAIEDTCGRFGLNALRADIRTYADDLLPNIRTYLHGCGMGIAVFDRLSTDEFNPNVSLEVGYMIALGKPVCLLKDKTLRALHTDLVGRLYQSFDPQNPSLSVASALERWLKDKQFV